MSATPPEMSPTQLEIIVYSYEMAPNPQKLFHFLSFFNIPYKRVNVPIIMTRPQLSRIGITYRRTPLLSINGDIYIDNALIISKVAEIARCLKMCLADATDHLEFGSLGQLTFQCSTGLIPLDTPFLKDEAFLADRSELMGRPFNPAMLPLIHPQMISKMLSLVHLVGSHFLSDGRRFFLGGITPSTADMHLYWSLNWGLKFHQGARPEISTSSFPKIFQWLEDVEAFIKDRRHETEISMDQANEVLQRAHRYAETVPHVEENPEGLQPGQMIKVTPVDTGKTGPQVGKLISLNYEQVCLRNEKGLVMHFPRMGYDIVSAGEIGGCRQEFMLCSFVVALLQRR